MGLPSQPVTLSAEEIAILNDKLSTVRHDINNHLSLMMATAEMMRLKPQSAELFIEKMLAQPNRISSAMTAFSAEFEKALGITRP